MSAATSLNVRLMNLSALCLVLGVALSGLVTLGVWVLRHEAFAVRSIAVTGDVAHNTPQSLHGFVGGQLADGLLTLDLNRVQAALQNAPWVRRAQVRRVFPGRLVVTLEEHQAAAYWGEEGQSTLVNKFGEVFEATVQEVEQDLPRLIGPNGQSKDMLAMYQAVGPLWAQSNLPISDLRLSNRGSWRVTLDSGAQVELGRGSVPEVEARVRLFLRTLAQVAATYGRGVNALDSADLRYRQAYALRLRGVSTSADMKTK